MYQVVYRAAAAKAMAKMPRAVAQKFRAAFAKIAANPLRRDLDLRPLQGRDGYRLRIGGWRAIYTVANDRLIILVLDVGARGGIYK